MTNEDALKAMGRAIHDLTCAMQAAFIEWQHGKGAEAAMQWIGNTLDGPGLIPDEDEPHGTDAQAWWDANNSHPIGPCDVCGKPSNIVGGGAKACSREHFEAAKNTRPNAKVSGAGTASAGLPGYAGNNNGE